MRLAAVAILRNDVVEHRGLKSHYELRRALGDADPMHTKPGDTDGFITDTGQFFSRRGAVPVAVRAGQLDGQWLTIRRDLLSSDLDWEAKPVHQIREHPIDSVIEEIVSPYFGASRLHGRKQHSDSLLRMLGKKKRRG